MFSKKGVVKTISSALASEFSQFVWLEEGKYYTSRHTIEEVSLLEGVALPEVLVTALDANNVHFPSQGSQDIAVANHTLDTSRLKVGEWFEMLAESAVVISIPAGHDIDGHSSVIMPKNHVAHFVKVSETSVIDTNLTRHFDSQGRELSQLLFEGGGINSSSVTGWTRRFNGMTCSNSTGMMFEKGAIIQGVECTNDSAATGRFFRIYHYNEAGGDGQLVYNKELVQEGGQFLSETDLELDIPPRRRLAIYLTGTRFRYPQYRLEYRRVL